MYYIINRTTNQTTVHHGDWPNLNEQLTNGQDIIVVSLYSNTIKTPYMENDCWEWKDYNAPFLLYPADDPKDIDYPCDDDYDDMVNNEYDEQAYDEPEINTDYIIASTNEMLQETMIFPANEYGQITQYTDLTSIALRNGHEYWEDAFAAVILLNTDEYKYIHVRTLDGGNNIHNLFKKINISDIVVI